MVISDISITPPRLRMTRYSPTHEKSVHSTSEAGPSRLPEISQLVNLSLKDMDISDDNIYASDVPPEPSRRAAPQISAKTENPAAVLRALLSRLPNNETPAHHPDNDMEHQDLSERESDYDAETASAATSVAQSSLKNIFSRALREPGDTPRKDRSHRRRSSSIGGTDTENTPHILEARDIKGKRRSLSDDEVDSPSTLPRTRTRQTPQPLTHDFLRERFGRFSDSPVKHQDTAVDKNAVVHEVSASRLDSSPPMATSTPQRSLMSFNQSRFNSNLLDNDSEMQNAFDALDDNLSNRSISPIPTLQMESESVDYNTQTKPNEITGRSLQTSTPRFNNKSLSVGVPSTAKASRSKLAGVYTTNDSLGEQSMSLSLPMGHTTLQPDFNLKLPNGTNGSLSRQHSTTSVRSSSPMPIHHRPHTPVSPVHDKERNWNKPQTPRHKGSSSHLSPHSSMSSNRSSSPMQNRKQVSDSPVDMQGKERYRNSPHPTQPDRLSPHHTRNHSSSSPRAKSPMHRPESPVDIAHERERNWNAPHPKWHDGSSLHTSKENSLSAATIQSSRHLRTKNLHDLTRDSTERLPVHHTSSRNSSPFTLPPEDSSSSLTRTSSIGPDPHPAAPSSPTGRSDFESVATNGSPRRRATPVPKLPSNIHQPNNSQEEDQTTSGKDVPVSTPYGWPVISSDHRQAQATPNSNGHAPTSDFETDDVRETDLSSSSDTPKSRPTQFSDRERHLSGLTIASKAANVPPPSKNMSPDALQTDFMALPSTPPDGITPRNRKLEFKTPSPPKSLPDLPTPSSSDESNNSPLRRAKIPKFGNAHPDIGLQTPKPPGGWLGTPQSPKFAGNTVLPEPETPVTNISIPETPAEASRHVTKTPKPPGGWTTPAPASAKSAESIYPKESGHRSQLLTPVNSLSRASAIKTPAAPGGWINTPSARKSLLKVRFDPQSPEVKEESGLYAQDSAPKLRDEDSNASELDNLSQADNAQDLSLPPPHSPRRPKANIRVLDAFGREEMSSSPKDSRSSIRVLDAMGREVEEEQIDRQDELEERTTPNELVLRLRRGLNELGDDIEVKDEDGDFLASDLPRIKELVATSKHARGVRERLTSQTKTVVAHPPMVNPPSVPFRWKKWLGLIVAQVLICFLVNRLSTIQAFNVYYDPFNPELHWDHPGRLSRFGPSMSPRALFRGGDTWSTWIESIDAYLSTFLFTDVVHTNIWTPT